MPWEFSKKQEYCKKMCRWQMTVLSPGGGEDKDAEGPESARGNVSINGLSWVSWEFLVLIPGIQVPAVNCVFQGLNILPWQRDEARSGFCWTGCRPCSLTWAMVPGDPWKAPTSSQTSCINAAIFIKLVFYDRSPMATELIAPPMELESLSVP